MGTVGGVCLELRRGTQTRPTGLAHPIMILPTADNNNNKRTKN